MPSLDGGSLHWSATVLSSYFQVPLTWTELLKRAARETQNDNGLGLAAELAYYFFLALFPALLFMLAVVSFFPVSDLPGRLAEQLASVAPPEIATIIRDQLAQLWQGRHGGLRRLASSLRGGVRRRSSPSPTTGSRVPSRGCGHVRPQAILLTSGLATASSRRRHCYWPTMRARFGERVVWHCVRMEWRIVDRLNRSSSRGHKAALMREAVEHNHFGLRHVALAYHVLLLAKRTAHRLTLATTGAVEGDV